MAENITCRGQHSVPFGCSSSSPTTDSYNSLAAVADVEHLSADLRSRLRGRYKQGRPRRLTTAGNRSNRPSQHLVSKMNVARGLSKWEAFRERDKNVGVGTSPGDGGEGLGSKCECLHNADKGREFDKETRCDVPGSLSRTHRLLSAACECVRGCQKNDSLPCSESEFFADDTVQFSVSEPLSDDAPGNDSLPCTMSGTSNADASGIGTLHCAKFEFISDDTPALSVSGEDALVNGALLCSKYKTNSEDAMVNDTPPCFGHISELPPNTSNHISWRNNLHEGQVFKGQSSPRNDSFCGVRFIKEQRISIGNSLREEGLENDSSEKLAAEQQHHLPAGHIRKMDNSKKEDSWEREADNRNPENSGKSRRLQSSKLHKDVHGNTEKTSRSPQYIHKSQHTPNLVSQALSFFRSYLLPLVATLALLQLLPFATAIVYRKQMSGRVITTRYGKVRGILVEFPSRHLRPVEAYFGLRYADLERGNMRFMPPKNPNEQWNGILAAVDQKPVCPQLMRHEREYQGELPAERVAHLRNITPFLTEQTEDCLTLNLYVPITDWNDTTPRPVMVFIHGETYDSGTGNAYDGSVLSSFGDVIVVTLNYRLGVLGFLTTLDHGAIGNQGLLDIIQALLWLQENIASFSGDPRRVTLFGHGHGAALVNLLLVSPFVSEGRSPFFQQAIIQSGSALSTWAVSYDPLWCAQKLAINANCSSFIDDSNKLVTCLRERSFTELLNAAPEAPKYYTCFSPAVESFTVLTKPVEMLIKEKNTKFAQVPVMFGITKNEAYSYLKQQEIHKGISDFRKTQIIRTYVQNVFRYHRQKIFEILDHEYTDWTQRADKMSNRNNILELLSDGQYVAPLIKTANYHAETAPTYLYAFSYSTQSETQDEGPSEDVQGIHGDELPYVFGSPLVDGLSPFPSSYTNSEKMLSEAVMTYWTNFAKTGNPNLPRNQTSIHAAGKVNNRFEGMKWPPYDKDTQQYMLISRRPSIRNHYRAAKLALWLDLIPKINVPDVSDPTAHLLANSTNQTTFDDYHRLIPLFDSVFPSPPPMPPIAPTMSYNDEPSTPGFYATTKKKGGGLRTRPGPHGSNVMNDDTTADDTDDATAVEDDVPTTAASPVAQETSEKVTNPVPLSITVAVGCSLLFLNILIFAGIYYQRRRIRKLRHQLPDDLVDVKLGRKLDRESKRNSVAGPETDSLMSGGAGGGSYIGGAAGLKGAHEDSPAREIGGPGMGGAGGGGMSHAGTLGRRSPPQNGKKSSSGTLSRSSADTLSFYNYTPVPTQSSSPTHRPHAPLPPVVGNSTNPHVHHPHPPMQMNTFSNSTLGKGTKYGGVGVLPRVGVSEAADTGLYKVINKSAPPPPPIRDQSTLSGGRDGGREGGGANNAITIV